MSAKPGAANESVDVKTDSLVVPVAVKNTHTKVRALPYASPACQAFLVG